ALQGLRAQIDAVQGALHDSLGKLSNAVGDVEQQLHRPLMTPPAAPPETHVPAGQEKIAPPPPLTVSAPEPAPEPVNETPPAVSQPPPLPPWISPSEEPPLTVNLPREDKTGPQQEIPAADSAPPPASPPLREAGSPELHIGQKWLLFAGIIITVLGVGYFLKLAFNNNWIPAIGRVAMAYLLGGAFLGAGEWFRRKGGELLRFGLPLIGCGVVILYFSSFAAYQVYHLVNQGTAFGLMALITAFTGILSLKYNSKAVAVVGLVGGFVTPLLLSTGENSYLTLFTYLTILNLGVVWLSFYQRWGLLNILGFIFTWLIFSGWHFKWYDDTMFWPAIIYLNIFFVIYAVTPYAYFFRHRFTGQAGGFSLSVINSFIAFGFAYGMIKHHTDYPAASILSVCYAGVFFWMARHLHRCQPANKRSLIMTLAMGLLFLTITVPILFKGHWLTVFWLAEGAIILWAALKLESPRLRLTAIGLLTVVFIKFLTLDYPVRFGFAVEQFRYLPSYSANWLSRYFTTAVALGAMYAAARLLRKNFADESRVFTVVFALALFGLLTAEVSGCFADYRPDGRAAAVSAWWSIFAITLIISGFIKRHAVCRYLAIGLFAVTALKVIIGDMAHVSTPFRVLACVVLGLLLIGASYLYYRYSDVLLPKEKAADPPADHQS
ncbi:MAG: DUF2339 domain-containing protein, partial [Verrucomicrobiales bacterium]|nr:DUF2339 domain-containing protein [Verrucomicrobiales bacterium]